MRCDALESEGFAFYVGELRKGSTDPYIAYRMPYFLNALETKDLKRLTPFVGAGQSRQASAMLRATLWYYGRKGPYHPDRARRLQLRRALEYLQQVPRKHRD